MAANVLDLTETGGKLVDEAHLFDPKTINQTRVLVGFGQNRTPLFRIVRLETAEGHRRADGEEVRLEKRVDLLRNSIKSFLGGLRTSITRPQSCKNCSVGWAGAKTVDGSDVLPFTRLETVASAGVPRLPMIQ